MIHLGKKHANMRMIVGITANRVSNWRISFAPQPPTFKAGPIDHKWSHVKEEISRCFAPGGSLDGRQTLINLAVFERQTKLKS